MKEIEPIFSNGNMSFSNETCENLQPINIIRKKPVLRDGKNKANTGNYPGDEKDRNDTEQVPRVMLRSRSKTKNAGKISQMPSNLFRLFVKNGEYVYARSNDIIMMESCDHLVKVYLASNDKIKRTVRQNTLKDFLLQLPQDQFLRIGRFCAINLHRLTGGNHHEQTFEFDYRVSIKLKHAISPAAFNTIGK